MDSKQQQRWACWCLLAVCLLVMTQFLSLLPIRELELVLGRTPPQQQQQQINYINGTRSTTSVDGNSSSVRITDENITDENGGQDFAGSSPAQTGMKNKLEHFAESLVHLPLLPWEAESLVNRTCHPPPGVPQYCCIGSIAGGGGVTFEPAACDRGVEAYSSAHTHAFDTLGKHPLVFKDGKGTGPSVVRCDACRITDILLETNWTLAFQGDSITRQTFFGLECELRRRGYHVSVNVTVVPNKTSPWRVGMTKWYELKVSKTPIDDVDSIQLQHTATIRYYGMYRPDLDSEEIKEIAASNDILIFDHGLHYGAWSGTEFIDDMTRMMQMITNSSTPMQLLAWRETSAQHFNTSGGHYVPPLENRCVPMDAADVEGHNIMGEMMKNVTNNTGTEKLLTVFPFRAYTSQLLALHTNSDCSHFCSSPSLWLPLWRSIRIALDVDLRR